MLLNKFPNPWNKHFSIKFEIFANQLTIFRLVAIAQIVINREMIQLCLRESKRRHIKEVTWCCDDIQESRQYECENYPNYKPKRKRITKLTWGKAHLENQ